MNCLLADVDGAAMLLEQNVSAFYVMNKISINLNCLRDFQLDFFPHPKMIYCYCGFCVSETTYISFEFEFVVRWLCWCFD